jgi:hypothetical protein
MEVGAGAVGERATVGGISARGVAVSAAGRGGTGSPAERQPLTRISRAKIIIEKFAAGQRVGWTRIHAEKRGEKPCPRPSALVRVPIFFSVRQKIEKNNFLLIAHLQVAAIINQPLPRRKPFTRFPRPFLKSVTLVEAGKDRP